MTYDLAETSAAEGQPYFLYLFAEGDQVWRFTSRTAIWTSPAGAIADETEDLIWDPSAVSQRSRYRPDSLFFRNPHHDMGIRRITPHHVDGIFRIA